MILTPYLLPTVTCNICIQQTLIIGLRVCMFHFKEPHNYHIFIMRQVHHLMHIREKKVHNKRNNQLQRKKHLDNPNKGANFMTPNLFFVLCEVILFSLVEKYFRKQCVSYFCNIYDNPIRIQNSQLTIKKSLITDGHILFVMDNIPQKYDFANKISTDKNLSINRQSVIFTYGYASVSIFVGNYRRISTVGKQC